MKQKPELKHPDERKLARLQHEIRLIASGVKAESEAALDMCRLRGVPVPVKPVKLRFAA